MDKMVFTGTYRLQSNEHYNEYLKALNVGWLKRRTANLARPCVVVTEGAQGIINLKTSGPGVKQTSAEKTITLGEEHTEILPNGLETKGVTVQEGENSLITRISSQRGKIEVRREFTKDGMTQVIILIDKDIQATRFYKRVT